MTMISPHAPNYLAIANRAIWLSERREIAAQIANDRQAIMCLVEETLLRWQHDGLLVDKSPAHFAMCVNEILGDALNAIADEAIEVAGT